MKGVGQIEIDEVYAGIDKHGRQFIIPVQAKGGSDQLSTVQTKQDLACCTEKYPNLICRPISAQFLDHDLIAIFELCLDEDSQVRIKDEKHYRLVDSNEIQAEELRHYQDATD